MITTSSKWDAVRLNIRGRRHPILKITDGVSTWFISDKEMILDDGHVHQLLLNHGTIKTGTSIYSRNWKSPTATFLLSNAPYARGTGSEELIRLSDEIGDLRGNTIELYLMVGDNITALSDCAKVYVGIVKNGPKYNQDTISISSVAVSAINNISIPSTLVNEIFSEAPFDDEYIPIVYGEYTQDNTVTTALGLAKGARTNSEATPSYVISDHVLDEFTFTFMKHLSLPDVSEMLDATENVNDSGRGTTDFGFEASYYRPGWRGRCNVRPRDSYSGDYDATQAVGDITDSTKGFDRRHDTYAAIRDYIDNNPDMTGRYFITWDDYASSDYTDKSIGILNSRIGTYTLVATVETADGALTFTLKQAYLYYNYSGGDQVKAWNVAFGSLATKASHSSTQSITVDPPDLRSDWGWAFRAGDVDNADNVAYPFMVELRFTTSNGGDGVVQNKDIVKVYDIYMQLEHGILDWDTPVFAACKGITYGSWISSRSSNYSSGDVIEDPAGIVESILRDQMGLVSADIDLPSFIAAENTSVKARLNLITLNRMTAYDAIRQIAEQSTFCFTWGADGKARLINLSDKSPTTNRIIPFSHIKNGRVVVEKTKTIRNKMHVFDRWQEEHGRYSDSTGDSPIEDATSQSAYGTFIYTARWKNICLTSSTHVSAHMVNSTDGIWSKEHNQITFEAIGYTQADLVEGDWIELEAESCDGQVELFGATWASKQFVITNKEVLQNSIKLIAVKLW